VYEELIVFGKDRENEMTIYWPSHHLLDFLLKNRTTLIPHYVQTIGITWY